MTTSAPSSRNRSAMPLPRPLPPPVIRMRLPRNNPSLNIIENLRWRLSSLEDSDAGDSLTQRSGRSLGPRARLELGEDSVDCTPKGWVEEPKNGPSGQVCNERSGPAPGAEI